MKKAIVVLCILLSLVLISSAIMTILLLQAHTTIRNLEQTNDALSLDLSQTQESLNNLMYSQNNELQTTFLAVEDLISAITASPSKYQGVIVTVLGTACRFDKYICVSDMSDEELNTFPMREMNNSNTGRIRFSAACLDTHNVKCYFNSASISSYPFVYYGDFIRISGTISITEEKVYLNNCSYETVKLFEDRLSD